MQLFLIAFQQPIPFGISAGLVITMIFIIQRSAMTAEGGSSWVRRITGPNAKFLFTFLFIAWALVFGIGLQLEGLGADPTLAEVRAFIADPQAEAASFLGKATTRIVYDAVGAASKARYAVTGRSCTVAIDYRWGKRALVSLAFAVTGARIFPTLKYAMGHGRACTRVTVGGKSRPVLRELTRAA